MMINYLNLLVATGMKPVLFIYADGAGMGMDQQLSPKVKVIYGFKSGIFKHFKRISTLRKALYDNNVCKIISFATNGVYLSMIASLFSRYQRTPIIYRMVSIYSAVTDVGNRTLNRISVYAYLRVLCRRVDFIISQTVEMGRLLQEKNPILLRSKIYPISNFVDIKAIEEKSGKVVKLPDEYIIYVGRLSEEKQVKYIIEAYHRISNMIKQNLLIVGDGADKEELISMVREKGLESRVIFEGKQHNPYPYIVGADILVLFSRYEGFPNVLIESMLCKTAVISSTFAGVDEIINHKENGYLVENGNLDDLANAIIYLSNNIEKREQIILNAYKDVLHKNIQAQDKYVQLAIK